MAQQFGSYGNNNRSNFLKKKKNEKELIEKREKQIKCARKIQAFFMRIKSKSKFFKPFYSQTYDKLLLIIEKKKQVQLEKFEKMMSNAVFKMPFFFQILIFLNQHNFKTYKNYLLNLIQVITDNKGRGTVIKKILTQKQGFQFYQLKKLVRFSLELLSQDILYQRLILQYIQESKKLESQTYLDELLKNQKLHACVISILKNQSNNIMTQLRQTVFQIIFLKHYKKYNIINANDYVVIALKNLPFQPSILQANDKFFVQSFSIQSLAYLEDLQLKSIEILYIETQKWLQFIIINYQKNIELVKIALELHQTLLRLLVSRTIKAIKYEMFSKKMQIQDPDYEQYINESVKQSIKYTSFLQRINLDFYFGQILIFFNFHLKGLVSKSIISTKLEIQNCIEIISRIYIQLTRLFQKIHNHHFNKLYSNEILNSLFRIVENYDISKIQFMDIKSTFPVIILEFFVRQFYQKFEEIDDVQFAQGKFGLKKSECEKLIKMVNQIIYEIIVQNTNDYKSNQDLLNNCIELSNDLYNKCLRTKYFNIKIFENFNLTDILIKYVEYPKVIRILLTKVPFFFGFEARLKTLKYLIKQDKKNYDRRLYHDEDYDNQHTITIRRGNQFNDAFQQCSKKDLHQKYKIVFINQQGHQEPGIDGGGIMKQFLNRVIKIAFDPIYGLFVETSDKQILPNPYAKISNYEKEYQFIGLLVGKAIYENILIEPKFSGPFLNSMIGRKNCFEDLKFVDRQLYNSLINLKHSQEDVQTAHITFSFTENLYENQSSTVQLKQNGKNIFVTNQNKLEFIMAYANHKVNKQSQKQAKMFRKGFTKIIKDDWLNMFNHEELQLMISGKDANFDVKDLKNNTVYNGYTQQDLTIIYFWEILEEMTSQQKSLLLLFVTSCSRPPTLGFQQLKPKFAIAKHGEIGYLPIAQTCMNLLKLPNYKNKQLLKKKLIYAINSKTGFELA